MVGRLFHYIGRRGNAAPFVLGKDGVVASTRFNSCPSSHWNDVAKALRRAFPEEGAALSHLVELNQQYQDQQHPAQDNEQQPEHVS